jgi:hypothetical protein
MDSVAWRRVRRGPLQNWPALGTEGSAIYRAGVDPANFGVNATYGSKNQWLGRRRIRVLDDKHRGSRRRGHAAPSQRRKVSWAVRGIPLGQGCMIGERQAGDLDGPSARVGHAIEQHLVPTGTHILQHTAEARRNEFKHIERIPSRLLERPFVSGPPRREGGDRPYSPPGSLVEAARYRSRHRRRRESPPQACKSGHSRSSWQMRRLPHPAQRRFTASRSSGRSRSNQRRTSVAEENLDVRMKICRSQRWICAVINAGGETCRYIQCPADCNHQMGEVSADAYPVSISVQAVVVEFVVAT